MPKVALVAPSGKSFGGGLPQAPAASAAATEGAHA
jgi:hypothetical protein